MNAGHFSNLLQWQHPMAYANIRTMFTYQYAQPDFYHYSLDSTQFAELVAARVSQHNDLSSINALDLCAGCGVIGFELSWHLPSLRKIDFLEIQSTYAPYFQRNTRIVNREELQLKWLELNYDTLLTDSWKNKYHLIVSNPPYFHPEHGMLSPSHEKNRCRFFIDSNFENYILAIANSLAVNGEAYILLRSLAAHGQDIFATLNQYLINTSVTATMLTDIRGTDVVLLRK